MIRPVISELRLEHLPGLSRLFHAVDMAYATVWEWNTDNCLVATHEDEVVGFVACWHDNQPYAFVDVLLVHPTYKGQGIGAWLCWAMEAILISRGVKCIRCVASVPEIVPPLTKEGFQHAGTHAILEKFYVQGV